jgi:LuxR family maltose regulon positive regulatory protein
VVIEVDESLTYARLFVSMERNLDALDILNPIISNARTDGRTWDELDGLLLSARALSAIDDQQAAQSRLIDAVSLTRSNKAIRPFIDAGEGIIVLLADLPRDGKNGDHIERILQAASTSASDNTSFVQPARDLTPRELQILRLISLGLTNQAIGERIGIAESTVKRHVSNMLIKLEANNRTEALHRARQLQILTD